MADERRPPRDMRGLLNFCTELTVKEDAPNSGNIAPMDSERQQFLKKVLEEMTVNTAKKIAECLQHLANFNSLEDHSDDDIEEIEQHLEDLLSLTDDIDNANDLVKMGGLKVLLQSLESPVAAVREMSCEVLSEICQNNPNCQAEMLNQSSLSKLLNLVDNDPSDAVKVKALYATSSLVRNHGDSIKQFEELDGFSFLMRAMQTDSEKLFIKSAFLISNLLLEYAPSKDTMLAMGYAELLISRLHSPTPCSDLCREHCTSALLKLCTSAPQAVTTCLQSEGFSDVLSERLDAVRGKEEYQEEFDYIQELLKLFSSQQKEPISPVDAMR